MKCVAEWMNKRAAVHDAETGASAHVVSTPAFISVHNGAEPLTCIECCGPIARGAEYEAWSFHRRDGLLDSVATCLSCVRMRDDLVPLEPGQFYVPGELARAVRDCAGVDPYDRPIKLEDID